MTFYEIAEKLYTNSANKIREENTRKSMYAGSPNLSIYDRNKEPFEQAKQGYGPYKPEDFYPWLFHPCQTKQVIVDYTVASGKESQEVPLQWTLCHGEIDEINHAYPDDIEHVWFIKDEERFWV